MLERLETRRVLASLPFSESPLVNTLGPAGTVQVIGDFDGDGREDIVTSRSGNLYYDDPAQAAWYRLNLATQQWEQAGTFPAQRTDWNVLPRAAVDMDGDHDLDLVVETSFHQIDKSTWLDWIENSDGKGTFTTLHSMNAIGTPLTYFLADFDEDGDTDVSFFWRSGPPESMAWSENRPSGFVRHDLPTIEGSSNNIYDPDKDGNRVVPAFVPIRFGKLSSDLDGDGDRDLIENNNGISYWLENTDGQAHFKLRGEVDPDSKEFEYVLPQDIDRDGDVDLWTQSGSTVAWLENQGNWNFVRHQWNVSVGGPIFTADIDGDGIDNLAALDPVTHQLIWYETNLTANVLTPHVTQVAGPERAEAAADVNRDGRTDIVGLLGWYERTANGHEFVMHAYPAGVNADQVAVSDLDGDGLLDFVFSEFRPISFGSTELKLSWIRQTTAGLSTPTLIGSWRSSVLRWLRDSQDLQIRDLDGDGRVDLLQLSHGTLTWFQQTAPQTFVRRTISGAPGAILSLDNLIDWDGDKDLDAVMVDDSSGRFALHLQTSMGTFTPSNLNLFLHPESLDVGDLDGDGDLDLAYARETTGGPGEFGWIPFQDGKAGEAKKLGTYPPDYMASIHAADLNGDGALDLVVQQDGPVEIVLNIDADYDVRVRLFEQLDVKGTFEEAQETLEHRGPVRLIADINDDHLLDLVLSPQTVTGMIVHYNQSPAPFPAGDINRDGTITVADVDAFCMAFRLEDPSSELDVNRDRQINEADHAYLVEDLLHLVYGDANFDGQFDSSDLVLLFAAGHYEKTDAPATWGEGDFNCDGRFDSADLVKALQGGYAG